MMRRPHNRGLKLRAAIVERKRTEAKLMKSEQLLSEAQKIAHIGSWEHDLATGVGSWSDELYRIYGLKPGSVPQPYEMFLELVHPNDREKMDKVIKETIASHKSFDFHHRIIRPDGMIRIIHSQGRAILDSDGKPVSLIGTAQDVTNQKLAEQQIQNLNAKLEARASELEDAYRELEAFTYTVTHDLRKPLTVINSYCQAVLELYGDILGEACEKDIREIYNGTLRMNQLIDSLLRFSSLGRSEIRREDVNLGELACSIARDLKMLEPERKASFIIADEVIVNADPQLIRIVLDNLIGNAWKYTGKREETIIEFGITDIEGRPTCFVRDNGTGFDMADIDMIFMPFKRTLKADEFTGYGIGLATVEKIISRHGGWLWAESEPDKGATFYFTV